MLGASALFFFFLKTPNWGFFDINGAKKIFCLEQGLEWKGEDTFDEYC